MARRATTLSAPIPDRDPSVPSDPQLRKSSCALCLIFAGNGNGAGETVNETLRVLDGRFVRFTIAGVASAPPFVTFWAVLSGRVTYAKIEQSQLSEAVRTARQTISAIPPEVSAMHCATHTWSELLRLARDHDLVVVAGSPCKRRDRRVLARLKSAGVQVWVCPIGADKAC